MKPDKLSDAIGLVDELLIEEADKVRRVVRRNRRWWRQWIAIAACLCLAVACVFALPHLATKLSTDTSVAPSSTSATTSAPTTTTTGNKPVVSKAMVVSKALSPSGSKYDSWTALRQGNYAKSFSAFYDAMMKQFLIGEAGDNRVISPANLFVSLAMLAETADGNSRLQILELLGADAVESVRKQAHLLWETNYYQEDYVASEMANSLWLNDTLRYKKDLLDTLSEHYYASSFMGSMGSGVYNTMLQDWLNEKTGNVSQEQVAGVQMDPSTVLNLVSTIYFGARWADEFDPNLNEQGVFHAASGDVPCEFMRYDAERTLEHVHIGNGYKEVSLRLGTYGMYFFLPDEGVSVNDMLRNNNLCDVLVYDQNASSKDESNHFWDVKLRVPKFDISDDVDLKSGLRALGVTDIFDGDRADFGPMLAEPNGVAVSSVQHAARVSIDEQGCTAAAFTRTDYGMGAPESNGELDFILDRPFVFCIADGHDSILFAGVVEQP